MTRKQILAKIAEYEARKAFWYGSPPPYEADNLRRLQAEQDKYLDLLTRKEGLTK